MRLLAQAADPAVVRRTVEEVLSRPEYADAAQGQSLLDRSVAAVLEALGRLLVRLGGPEQGGTVWGVIGLLLLVGVLVAMIVALVRRFRRSAVLPEVVDGQIGRSPRDWGAEAVAHEAAGRYRQALRCRYRETLALLAAEALLDEVPGRTTGEYLAEVGASLPDARPRFAELTRVFEGAWYGGRRVDAGVLAAARDAQVAVVRTAGLRARAITTEAPAAGVPA